MSVEFTLDELSDCLIDDADNNTEDTDIDLFDGKFTFSFYGLLPNTILKEDSDVIAMLVQISINSLEARNKIVALVRDMDIFVKHMEKKILASIPPTVDAVTVNEVYDKFYEHYMKFKEAASAINYNLTLNQGEEVTNFISGNMRTFTDRGKVEGIIAYIIGTDSFDRIPTSSVAITIADTYKSLIQNNTIVKDIVDSYSRLPEILKKQDTKNLTQTTKTLIKLSQYSSRSYYFTDKEVEAMKYLGFPYQVAGYEKYFKSSPKRVLDEMVAGINKSKSNVQAAMKQQEIKREDALAQYAMTFSRKSYICKENSKVGVNASCIYF